MVALTTGIGTGESGWLMAPHATFDESEIRAAERRLETALEADDPTLWVFEYTEDAVFDGGGDHAVVGRESLLAMARSMRPLRSVSIRPLRTEGRGDLAAVWTEASWVSGEAQSEPTLVEVRGIIVWRREADGTWRVAMERIG
jgi:ketosteroid isomerase-like protein